jgi:hypothetical protein
MYLQYRYLIGSRIFQRHAKEPPADCECTSSESQNYMGSLRYASLANSCYCYHKYYYRKTVSPRRVYQTALNSCISEKPSVFVLFKFKMLKNHHFSSEPWFHSVAQNQFQPQVRTSFSFCFKTRFGLKFRKSFKFKFRTSFKMGGGGGQNQLQNLGCLNQF